MASYQTKIFLWCFSHFMGAILNNLRTPEIDSLENLSTKNAEWLTSHADATGLAVVEVERLWHRFQLLTGSDETGILLPNSISDEISRDLFVRNFLQHFPRAKSNPAGISFGYFIVVMQWLEISDLRTKLAGVFLYLNNGQPIGVANMATLFKLLYPEKSENEVKAIAVAFMEQLGSDAKGQLNQEQFIKGMQRIIPAHQLEQLLRFEIIPNEVLNDVRDDGPSSLPPSNRQTPRSNNYTPGNDMISDDQFRQIADRAARRNWQNLAIQLGFLEYDIEAYKTKNRGDPQATIYDMLLTWRDENLSPGKKDRLRRCLQQSGFNDLLPILDQ